MSKETTRYIITTVATFALVITITVSQAWTSPSLPPTGGSITAPLTVGGASQFKTGPIGINTGAVPSAGFGLGVGGNVAVGGKIYSASTVAGDPANTVVTKDFLQKTFIGPVDTTSADNTVYGPAADDFFVSVQLGGNNVGDNQAEFCAGPNSTLVGMCYCTGLNKTGACHGGSGTGASYIRARVGAYSSGMAIVRKGEYWQTQHFDHNADGGETSTIIYPIGYARVSL